uniref:Uncharacterized protein n=1 Tax=Oryza brachyantha TaxID=4533 RepID=J3ME52_ORYBR
MPEMLQLKAFEPIMLAGRNNFKDIDTRICVRGGGKTSQIGRCLSPIPMDGLAGGELPTACRS